MSQEKKSTEADDVLEFLNSLPETDKTKEKLSAKGGKSDEDIFEFLDELAAEDKKKEGSPISESSKEIKKPTVVKESKEIASEGSNSTQTTPEKPPSEETADPIASISSWWSNTGSTRVGSQVSSIWGTAQSLKQSAQEKAEEAIKLAREKGLEENVRKAFQEVGITGVRGEDGLTEEERLKLPDAHQALESLNKGFGFFQNKLSGVIDKIQTDFENAIGPHDEVLDVKLVHDLKNYGRLNQFVTDNFESVMSAQVDGDIQVRVTETQTVATKVEDSDSRSLSLFQGKVSDAEKLVFANIESVIKTSAEVSKSDDSAKKPQIRKSDIYIGLQAVAVQPTTTSTSSASDLITIDSYSSGSFSFTTVLKDTTHNITIVNRSQPFPLKWAKWLDDSEDKKDQEEDSGTNSVDADVEPAEWVIDWVNKGLDMTFGVLAQSYIIRRMGY